LSNEKYTGFRTFDVPDNLVEDIHCDGKILPWDKRHTLYPNMYVELRGTLDTKKTAIARVSFDAQYIEKISPQPVYGLAPRNREQAFALDALMDDTIPVVVLTGIAGSGKTILTLAVALEKIQTNEYKRVIITRPMSHVGKYPLGALPGDVEEKFGPYLLNYTTNLEQFVGKKRVDDLLDQCRFEMVPIQLMRGASFNQCLVIADEVQVCDYSEILAIGTRIGEGSKIVLMGDLSQRDEKISREKTGLFKLTNDFKAKSSPLVAAIELQKCERSDTASFFADLFEE